MLQIASGGRWVGRYSSVCLGDSTAHSTDDARDEGTELCA